MTTALVSLTRYYYSVISLGGHTGAYGGGTGGATLNGVPFAAVLVSLSCASILSLLESLQTNKPPPNGLLDWASTIEGVTIGIICGVIAPLFSSLPLDPLPITIAGVVALLILGLLRSTHRFGRSR